MKISINMLSCADKIAGQGVGSAYLELLKILREDGKNDFDVFINKGIHYDVLHAHNCNFSYYLKLKFTKAAKVVYVHFLPETLDGSIKLPKLLFRFFKWYVIKFYKLADYIVVVNPIFIKDLVRYGIDEKKIHYIPNFVSKEMFYKIDNKEKNELYKKYNLNKNKFIVLGAGQVQTRKGVMDFVNVAKELPDIDFIWAGGFSFGNITDGYHELKEVMDNPPNNVKFLGIVPREDMNELFNLSNVLFVPSYNELFPMTILEAVSTETPILLRDLELYEDILFKKYVSGHNNKDFIKEIKRLSTDKDFYNKQVDNSKYLTNFYSKDNVYKMWNKFYKDIVKNNKKGSK